MMKETLKRGLMKLMGQVPCEGPAWPDGCLLRRGGLCAQVDKLDYCALGHMAEHLSANGVTILRWVDAAMRKPPEDRLVWVVVLGRYRNLKLENCVEEASWSEEEGWILSSWPNWEDPQVSWWMEKPPLPGERRTVKKDRLAIMQEMGHEELARYLLKQFDGGAYCRNLSRCDDLLENGMPIPEEDCLVCMLQWLMEVPEAGDGGKLKVEK